MMPSGDFASPSELGSSVALAAICQDVRYGSIIDKTMLAANAAAPEGIIASASVSPKRKKQRGLRVEISKDSLMLHP